MLFNHALAVGGGAVPTKINWSLVDNSAKRIADGARLDGARAAFPILVLSKVLGLTYEEAADSITDGASDRGIDALHFDEDHFVLHLFNFKYHDDFVRAGSSFPGNEIEKVVGFIDGLISLNASLKDTCNHVLSDKVEYLWDKISVPQFSIRVYFASNGSGLNPNDRAVLCSTFVGTASFP
jgi:hypothetical protein